MYTLKSFIIGKWNLQAKYRRIKLATSLLSLKENCLYALFGMVEWPIYLPNLNSGLKFFHLSTLGVKIQIWKLLLRLEALGIGSGNEH